MMQPCTSPRFFYKPLQSGVQSIRVITLNSGSFSEPICIELNEVILGVCFLCYVFLFHLISSYLDLWPNPQSQLGSLQYEALSYFWGSKNRFEDAIMADGRTIPIAKNLSIALRHLRHQTEKRQLWIDALCINQADKNERSSQIALMGDIYRRANCVIAWIGPEEENSSEALELIHRS